MSEIWMTVKTPNRRVLQVLLDGPLVLGRDCDGLILVDQRVSRRHTSFDPTDGGVRVTDLDSSNGTQVNGIRITGPTMITPGDAVVLGNTSVTFQQVEASGHRTASLITELTTPTEPELKTSIDLVAESIGSDDQAIGAEVIGGGDDPGTLTVMFSDIESSTELAVAMGDTDWFALLGRHHQLVSAHVDAHKGRIVKNQGDGYMLCFRSAHQALLAAIGMQRDLARLGPSLTREKDPEDSHKQLRVRMGAHTGEVLMQDDGDLFGKHVIVAARVGAMASGGQILVSSLLKQIAEPRGDIPFGPPLEVNLKGISGPSVIHEVDWAGYDDQQGIPG